MSGLNVHDSRRDQQSVRVLHVDDDPGFGQVAADLLELTDERLRVESLTSVSDGLERIEAGGVDCVVSDYDMPERNGIDFLEAVRENHPDLPFILFTGKGSEEVAADAVSAGVTDYLQKEYGSDQYTVLANRIVNATARRRTETDLERRTEQHESVAALGRQALEADDVMPVFESAVTLVADGLDCEFAKVLDLQESGRLALVSGVGWADGLVGTATVGTGDDSQAGHTLESAEPIVVSDLATETRFTGPDLLTDHGIVSGISVVIGTTEQPWGVLGVHTASERAFSDSDVTFVQNVANVLAAAIENQKTKGQFRESERRFREMAELSPDGLFRTDASGAFTYVSPASESLLGRTAAELEEMAFSDVVSDESIERAVEGFERVLDGESVSGLELELRRADGETVPTEVNAGPVVRDGDVVMVQGLARDISARRERERELQESRERYRVLVEEFPNGGVFLFDTDCRFTAVGGAELEEVGLSPEDIVGRTPKQLFPPEQAAPLMENYRAAIDGESRTFEDGWQGREYVVTVRPIRDDAGNVVSGMAVAWNVTAEREYQRALERLRERSQALMYTTTVEETVEVAIEAAEADVGASLSAFNAPNEAGDCLEPLVTANRTEEAFDHVPRYDRDAPPGSRAALVWEVFESGEPVVIDDTDGYSRLTESSPAKTALVYPVGHHGTFVISSDEPHAFDEADKSLATILVNSLRGALDRVEREQRLQRREERLERQNERLRRFANVLSHDLRNPLGIASGRLELARREVENDNLDHVAQAHDRIESLIDGLLRITLEESAVAIAPISLATVVRDAWQQVATGEASLVVETDARLAADESRLSQLLENLFRNSVEHGHREGQTLTITVGDVDGGFFVEDDGPGVPEADREVVFDMGYSSADGTGFGLSIVADIADEHGWSVTLGDGSEGGARFVFEDVDVDTE